MSFREKLTCPTGECPRVNLWKNPSYIIYIYRIFGYLNSILDVEVSNFSNLKPTLLLPKPEILTKEKQNV